MGSWTLIEQVLTPVGATSKVESSWNNLNTLNPKPRDEGFRVIRKHRDDTGFMGLIESVKLRQVTYKNYTLLTCLIVGQVIPIISECAVPL